MKNTIVLALVAVLFFGILIPKLTVHDLVKVDESLRQCATLVMSHQYDNTFTRLAVYLGKTRVVSTTANSVEVESFTLFRIPLGVLLGLPELRMISTCDFAVIPERLPAIERTPQVLFDGIIVQGLGQFHDVPAQNGLKAYVSDKLDVSFSYPSEYLLFEGKGEGTGGAEYYVTVTPETPVRTAMASIYGGEWPPSMHLSFFREPDSVLSLDQWIRTKSLSNFDPLNPAQNLLFVPTTVAGVSALEYFVPGLYDTQYVAFRYGEWVVIASADFGKGISPDFQTILSSIQFKNNAQ